LIEDEIKAIRGALLARAPFFGSLVLKCDFKFVDGLRYPAANDGRKTILINPQAFMQLRNEDRLFVLAHEAGHLALLSAQRRGERNPVVWNVATDCVINYLLLNSELLPSREFMDGLVTPATISKMTGVGKDELEKMSADQIYNLLFQHASTVPTPQGCSRDEYARHPQNCGSDAHAEGGIDEEYRFADELAEYWKRAIAEAVDFARSVGKLPAGMEIALELLKPKVNWKALLRQAILQGPGLQLIATWRRPHRKVPDGLPGYVRLAVPNIWTLVDTSGSMVGKHLNQVVTEVFEIAKTLSSKVRIIAWDADAYEDSLENVRKSMKIKGGGGTVIGPAINLLLKKMKPNDIVVILTDGLIDDGESPEIQRKLAAVASKAASAVFVTTVKIPPLPRLWRTVLIT
jgi:predicted metal-dependent peptidase